MLYYEVIIENISFEDYQTIKYKRSHQKLKIVMRPKLPNYCPKELDLSLIEAC